MKLTRWRDRRLTPNQAKLDTDELPRIDAADRFRFTDLVAEATTDIGSRPGRLVMTLAGTILGIGALVATIGFAQTTAGQIARQFDADAATQLTVAPAQAQSRDGDTVATATLPWDTVTRLELLAGIQHAALLTEITRDAGTITAVPINDPSAPTTAPPRLFAASADVLDTVGGTLSTGRSFDVGHDTRGDRVALLGSRAAERLEVTRIDTQPSIFIDGIAYAVIGIYDNLATRGDLADAVLIPNFAARTDFALQSPGEARARITVGAGPQLRPQVALTLAPDAPDTMDITAPRGASDLGQNVQADINIVFLILSVIVLLAGGLGIANVTTLSVMERTGEIGLRRALGATRRQIALQFVVESAIVGLLGGLIGASLGVLSVVTLSAIQQWTPVLDALIATGGALLGAIIGLTAGSIPARRASRIEPVTALRGA